MNDYTITITQDRWNAFFSEKPSQGVFDKDALLEFARSGRGATLHSPMGKLVNDGFFGAVSPITFRKEATEEILTWQLHVVKFYPANSQHEYPTHSIEFKSWIHPETGEECVCEFGNWADDSGEEEKEECYNILANFFPTDPGWDIKEPSS